MTLYICWGSCPVPGGSPCRFAYEALQQAGHNPKVVKAHGTRLMSDSLTARLPDERSVPVLVTDDGEVVSEARNIVAWAKQHPATPATTASSA
jgi:glutaredoxin 2